MAKTKFSVAEAPRPTYVAAPPEVVSGNVAPLSDLREQCRNASYSLLDKRDGSWCLMVFGSGQAVQHFHSLEQGVEFVRSAQLPKVRCLALPEGVIQ